MLIPFKELFARHKVKATGALHLGAHWGQEADAYAAQGITRVVWVEALPAALAKLKLRVDKYPDHTVLLACLSNKDGETVNFHVANNEGQSSSFLDFGTHSKEHPTTVFTESITMVTCRLDTLLAGAGITIGEGWLLNVDVQGAELLVLQGMSELIRKFKYAYIEVNDRELYKGCPMTCEIDDYLGRYGFVGVETKMTPHGWGDKFYLCQS